jgi:hypothetical protein
MFWFWAFLCSFPCLSFFVLLLALRFFLLLYDLLKLSLSFWSSNCALWSFGLELQTLRFLLSMDSSRGDWETKWSVPWFDCDGSLTWRGWNSNSGQFGYFTFIFISCGESYLLVSWCAGGRCDMAGSDKDHGRSRRPDVEDQRWLHMSDTRWPDDRKVRWRRV